MTRGSARGTARGWRRIALATISLLVLTIFMPVAIGAAYYTPPPNATSTVPGLIQLATDLGGTATAPTVVSVADVTTGTLKIANGGTNAGTGLSGSGAVVVENGVGIIQGPAGTATTVLHGNAAGVPTYGSVVNGDIASSTIDLTAKVTGTLPNGNGGTGKGTTWVQWGSVYADTTTRLSNTAQGAGASGATGQSVLVGNDAAAPTFNTSITQGAWTNCNFGTQCVGGCWGNFGGGYSPAGFFTDSLGVVHMRGIVSNNNGATCGAGGTTQRICTNAPSSTYTHYFAAPSNHAFAEITQQENGGTGIDCRVGSTAYVSLDGLNYDTR